MKKLTVVSRRVSAIVALVMAALSLPAMSASDCKGLAEQACANNTAGTWIDSYKTSKGKAVQSYCRSKPVKQPAKATSDKQG